MVIRIYVSNLSPIWPVERQERLLADVPRGAREFRDILTGRERMARDATRLVQRDLLTRATSRKDRSEETYVASLAVLDWSAEGMLAVVAAIQERGGVLRVTEPEMHIAPDASTPELQEAVAAFHAAKKREIAEKRGKTGGAISGKKRKDAAIARCAIIAERWVYGDPRIHKTADLLAEAGVTRNTAIEHLKKRPKR